MHRKVENHWLNPILKKKKNPRKPQKTWGGKESKAWSMRPGRVLIRL